MGSAGRSITSRTCLLFSYSIVVEVRLALSIPLPRVLYPGVEVEKLFGLQIDNILRDLLLGVLSLISRLSISW